MDVQALKRALWWAGRLYGCTFIACTAGAALILLELQISDWMTGGDQPSSVGDAIGQILFLVTLIAPAAAILSGMLPALVAGGLLLPMAIRTQRARGRVLWGAAGALVAASVLFTGTFEERDGSLWAVAILAGTIGGLLLRTTLSPSGRFDESRLPAEELTWLERWGYAILTTAWPFAALSIAVTFEAGFSEPAFLLVYAFIVAIVAMIVVGRRKRKKRRQEDAKTAALTPA